LLIDELSLGLAPIVVSTIIEAIQKLRAAGMTVVVVEQSINTSTSMAERALFMEKGQVRFTGAAEELKSSNLLRSVFIRRTGTATTAKPRARPQREAAPSALLEARGLTKTYGSVTAVRSLDLDVYQGQILGMIGPNGAGKTTIFD